MAALGTNGVDSAPTAPIPIAGGSGEAVEVCYLVAQRSSLRDRPLASWGQDYMDFPPQAEPDPFLLAACLPANAEGCDTPAEEVPPPPVYPSKVSSKFPMWLSLLSLLLSSSMLILEVLSKYFC